MVARGSPPASPSRARPAGGRRASVLLAVGAACLLARSALRLGAATAHRRAAPKPLAQPLAPRALAPGAGCEGAGGAGGAVALGVVASLEPRYLELASALARTWGADFPHKAIFFNGEANASSVPDPAVRALAANAFEGVDLGGLSLETRPGFEGQPRAWKLAQSMYLEACERLGRRFPGADWFMVVDADAYVDAACLAPLLAGINPARAALALGDVQPMSLDAGFPHGVLMGGPGVVWSAAAHAAVDWRRCIAETAAGGAWAALNSDWRVTRCFDAHNVTLVPALGFYQMRAGPSPAARRWYPLDARARTACVVSQHRVDAGRMAALHAEARARCAAGGARAAAAEY